MIYQNYLDYPNHGYHNMDNVILLLQEVANQTLYMTILVYQDIPHVVQMVFVLSLADVVVMLQHSR